MEGDGVRHGMCPTKRELSILPLPLGEAGRRPGEGAFRCGTFDESTLTPALSQRERENENRQQRCKIRVAELVPNRFDRMSELSVKLVIRRRRPEVSQVD